MTGTIRRTPRAAVAVAVLAAAVGAVAPTAALASPPIGVVQWTDRALVPAAGTATVTRRAGHGTTLAGYSFGATSSTGWRALTGTAVLAVTSGSLQVTDAKDCAVATYPAGGAAVLPVGRYLLTSAAPTEVTGIVTDVADGVSDPVTDGNSVAVTGCGATVAPSGVSATGLGRGVFADQSHYAHHGHETSGSFEVTEGKDVGFSLYKLAPGFSAGWHSHYGPFVAIVTRGALTYYEGGPDGCTVSGHYQAGDAYFANVVPGGDHNHLLNVDATQGAEVWGVYFDMPRTTAAVPVAGQQLDSIDFMKFPANGCPRIS